MRPLTPREKRTIRIGGIGVAIYLVLLGAVQVAKALSKQRHAYLQLVGEAQTLKTQMQMYEDRAALIKKMMESFQMDPARLYRTTVVAQASAAIQKAALSGGVALGSVRETAGRASNKELATIQLEVNAPAPSLLRFLHQMESLGYPVLIESFQISSDPARPGPLKMSLVIGVLDFDQWKKTEVPNASA